MRALITNIVIAGLMFYIVKVGMSGRMWGDHGTLAATNMRSVKPSLCRLGETGMAAAFPGFDEEGIYRAAIQGIDQDGRLFFEDGPLFLSSPEKWMLESNIIAEPDDEGGVFVIWQTRTDSTRVYDVFAQHLDQDLRPIWDEGGVLLYRTNDEIASRWRPHYYGIIPSDEGGLIIVDRVQVGERRRFFEHLFFVRKFDPDGSPAEGWPEEGMQIFETSCNIQFYQDPGRGLWCFGRNGSNTTHGVTLQVNLIQTDGTKHYEETIDPELPENSAADEFTPDKTGGFYLMLFEWGEDNFCRSGLQCYNSEGRPVWAGGNVWFTNVNLAHLSQVPIASEDGNRVFCFSYDGHGGDSPVSTRLNWIEPQENGPRLLWDDPMYFRNSQMEPFFYMGDGDLLINIMHHQRSDDGHEWLIERAEVNIISPGGRLLWDEGTASIEPHGKAVPIDWESFYVTTELETPDLMSDLKIDYLNHQMDREWEQPVQVYFMPQFGETIAAQLLPNESVRLIGATSSLPGPHMDVFNYQLINHTGLLQFPIMGHHFFDLELWAELATSNGSLLMVRYTGSPGNYTYTDVSVFDDQNVVHPDEPLPLRNLYRGGEFSDVFGDSVGGGFLVFQTGEDENRRYDIVRVNQSCEWDEEVLRPFDEPNLGYLTICAEGNGGAWITAWSSEEEYLLQRISAENELVWEEPRRWNSPRPWTKIWLPASDTSLTFIYQFRTEFLDSVNVLMMSFDRDGAPRWEAPATAFEPNPGVENPRIYIKAIVNSEGEVWLVASDGSEWPRPVTVRLQKMSPDGERLFGGHGVPVPLMKISHRPELVDDGDGGIWLFMEVFEVEPPYLRAFHFDRNGELIDDREEPDPNGTTVITHFVDGVDPGKFFPPWRYEDASVGIAFRYDDSMRAQRLNDLPNEAPQRESAFPEQFEITSVYPSPSNDRLSVGYRLERTGRIDLTLIDLAGRRVGLFYAGVQTAGEHQASISTGGLASGAYLIQLKAFGKTQQRVIVEMK